MSFSLMQGFYLPARGLMSWALSLGWAVVLAGLVLPWLARCWPQQDARRTGLRRAALLLLALLLIGACVALPGPWSPAYWLGLAFQAPSLVSVLCCVCLLYRLYRGAGPLTDAPALASALLLLACMGVLLGWLLLLDVFALFPVSVYAWGFGSLAVFVVALFGVLPVALVPHPYGPPWHRQVLLWVVPVAVLLFVVLRLPTGNVWDAVLDPWLWVLLQVYVFRRALAWWRTTRGTQSASQ